MIAAVGDGTVFGHHPIKLAYLSVLAVTVVGFAAMNYWVETRPSTTRIRAVLPLHYAAILWTVVSALELLATDPQLSRWLVYSRTGLSYVVVVLFVYFGTVYTGRSPSPRRPVNLVFLGGMAVGLFGLVTQPWLGLHFDPLVFHTDPFPYYETGFGPLWTFSILWSYLGISVALYYLLELFFTSQHRSSRPLVVYSLGIVLGLLPSFLTTASSVPTLPGYDHTVLGLSIVSFAFFAGAWLGMVEIAPISRDRLLETTDDALLVLDDRGQLADHNATAESFFTGGVSSPIGRPLSAVAPPLSEALPDGVLGAAITASRKLEFSHDDRRYSAVVSPITDGGVVEGSVVLVRDVTERYENRRELARQNRQLDDFASSIEHYLRNPLQVASGQTELARDRVSPDAVSDQDRERFDDLEQSLERIETIITDLRTLAKQGKSVESTAHVDFGDAVDRAAGHVATASPTVVVERDGTIRADQSRLLSILENLIRNSAEHGAGGDSGVTVTVRLTDDGFVFEDDGSGIDADDGRLFEYGYTTSDEGTGLGLSIVETMAESHGWTVAVDPDHDGARFVFTGAVTAVETATQAA